MGKRRAYVYFPRRHKRMKASPLNLLGKALACAFDELGFRGKLVYSYREVEQKKENIILMAHVPLDQLRDFPGAIIRLNFEPLPHDSRTSKSRKCQAHWFELKQDLKAFGGVAEYCFDYNETTTEFINSQGSRAFYLPIGYHPSFEADRAPPFDRGVYFLGILPPRRKLHAEAIGACCFDFLDHPYNTARLLHTPGVHLNIYKSSWRLMDWLRVGMLLLSNRRAVLSETPQRTPLVDGKHWITCRAENLPDTARALFYDHDRCRELGENGYRYIKKNYHLTDMLARSLRAAELY